jgi:hypothetical protein
VECRPLANREQFAEIEIRHAPSSHHTDDASAPEDNRLSGPSRSCPRLLPVPTAATFSI